MTTIQMDSGDRVEVAQLVKGVAQLETDELEELAAQINLLVARRKAPSLSARETELLQAIGHGLPNDVQSRYDELRSKLRAASLTAEEREELLVLSDRAERADADRLHHLIELAQLRQTSVGELMQQLNLVPPPVDV